jgi:hypothetical protein
MNVTMPAPTRAETHESTLAVRAEIFKAVLPWFLAIYQYLSQNLMVLRGSERFSPLPRFAASASSGPSASSPAAPTEGRGDGLGDSRSCFAQYKLKVRQPPEEGCIGSAAIEILLRDLSRWALKRGLLQRTLFPDEPLASNDCASLRNTAYRRSLIRASLPTLSRK